VRILGYEHQQLVHGGCLNTLYRQSSCGMSNDAFVLVCLCAPDDRADLHLLRRFGDFFGGRAPKSPAESLGWIRSCCLALAGAPAGNVAAAARLAQR